MGRLGAKTPAVTIHPRSAAGASAMTDTPTPNQIVHDVGEPWRVYLQRSLQEIETCREDELRLRGMILEAMDRSSARQRALQEIVTLLVREAGLPEGLKYTVSSDGSKLTATVTPS